MPLFTDLSDETLLDMAILARYLSTDSAPPVSIETSGGADGEKAQRTASLHHDVSPFFFLLFFLSAS